MKTAQFTIEFITSGMLGGAEPKGPESWAELRIPSIRGQFRWWFRMLEGQPNRESNFFGSVAGGSGFASTFALRILRMVKSQKQLLELADATRRYTPPKTARQIGCGNMNEAGYLAFNIRKPEDARAFVPRTTRFVIELRTTRLNETDFHWLCNVFRMFCQYGSLGARSRRTFGCLKLVDEKGDVPTQAATWDLFPKRRIDWRVVSGGPWATEAEVRKAAALWLKEHRNNRTVVPKKMRGELFGHAGQDSQSGEKRRASPVILRPFLESDRKYRLGLLIPRPLPSIMGKAIA